MSCTVSSGTLVGVDAHPVHVEVDLLRRLPAVVIVGLPGGAVRESADRVRSALQQADFEFPRKRVVVNLAPADLKKSGTGFDLPIAVGILVASEQVPITRLNDTAFFGELSLDGQLRRVRGVLPMALMAREQGLKRLVVPQECAPEAAVVSDLEVRGARTLGEVAAWMRDAGPLPLAEAHPKATARQRLDLSEVRGQHQARRALEVAAAGGHNLLMMGSPGCGKSMLAARLPSILPDLSFEEAIDITRVHSVAGLLDAGQGLVTQRPFRAPHHSVTAAGMIGNAALRPGEVSLAHHGVLFLDEIAEFQRSVLELLRGPLEDRRLHLTRASGSVEFPADISLVAAANPCPCGYLGHPTRSCSCSPGHIERYRQRLSGPLLDRIDLHVWVDPVSPEELARTAPGESSSAVRARVEAARARQRARHSNHKAQCNAQLQGDQVRQAAQPTSGALRILERTLAKLGLSARAWSRILKVARTVADLDGDERVDEPHVLEALTWRDHVRGRQ